jgi:hypothetical protein
MIVPRLPDYVVAIHLGVIGIRGPFSGTLRQ